MTEAKFERRDDGSQSGLWRGRADEQLQRNITNWPPVQALAILLHCQRANKATHTSLVRAVAGQEVRTAAAHLSGLSDVSGAASSAVSAVWAAAGAAAAAAACAEAGAAAAAGRRFLN